MTAMASIDSAMDSAAAVKSKNRGVSIVSAWLLRRAAASDKPFGLRSHRAVWERAGRRAVVNNAAHMLTPGGSEWRGRYGQHWTGRLG